MARKQDRDLGELMEHLCRVRGRTREKDLLQRAHSAYRRGGLTLNEFVAVLDHYAEMIRVWKECAQTGSLPRRRLGEGPEPIMEKLRGSRN